MSDITIDIDQRLHDFPVEQPVIRSAVQAVLRGEQIGTAQIGIAIVDNETIHEINREYLGHDFATDVISFVLSEEGGPLEGDLMISSEMAAAVAGDYGWSAEEELVLYVIHGTLHLIGYDDLQEDDREIMRDREAYYLREMGIEPSHRSGARTS